MFQEFDFEIVVKSGWLKAGPNYLSRVVNGEEPTNIDDGFPDVQLFWVDIANDHYPPISQKSEGFTSSCFFWVVDKSIGVTLVDKN